MEKKYHSRSEQRRLEIMNRKTNIIDAEHKVAKGFATPAELDYRSPLNIPENKIGKFEIKHEIHHVGEILPVVTVRNMLYMGVKAHSLKLESPMKIHRLLENGRCWMSDHPQETFLLNRGVEKAKGHVLIGGLGLGYIAERIVVKKNVKSVTVVEKEKAVINLVQPYINKDIDIVYNDLFVYLDSGTAKFDYAYFDIWCGTNEATWLDYVVPLRRSVWKHYGKKEVDCWGEQEMQSQIIESLYMHAWKQSLSEKKALGMHGLNIRPDDDCFYFPYFIFMKKVRQFFDMAKFEISEKDNKQVVIFFAQQFVKNVGSPRWEKLWNWDKNVEEYKKARKEKYGDGKNG